MVRHDTLERTWVGFFHGYPIKVEEHRSDLSYIVEFYDASDERERRCLAYDPRSGEELTVSALKEEEALVVA